MSTPGDLVRYYTKQQISQESIGSSNLIPPDVLKDFPSMGSNWAMRLFNPDAVDSETGFLDFIAFNNVDYSRWSTNACIDDFKKEPVGREQLAIGSIGIVIRNVTIRYVGPLYSPENRKDEPHTLVLFGQKLFLVEPSELQLLQSSNNVQEV